MARKTPDNPEGLTPNQLEFRLEWARNGFNGTQAYLRAYPGSKYNTARREAHRLLTNPNMVLALERVVGGRWKAMQVDGDQALARVGLDATSDHRDLYDDKGKPLHPSQWPDHIANSVDSFKDLGEGRFEVRFVSKGNARRVILETTGKLKGAGDGLSDLAAALMADLARADKARHERNPSDPPGPAAPPPGAPA